MKKTIKLLLLAVLASSAWGSIAAQESQPAGEFAVPRVLHEAGTLAPASKTGVDVKTDIPLALNEVEGKKSQNPSKKAPGRSNKVVMSDYEPLTVADGTVTNSHIPFYGYYYDTQGAYSQMIYPESMLQEIKNKCIYAIQFFAPNGITFSTTSGDGELTASIKNTTNTSFQGSTQGYNLSDAKQISIVPQKGDTELTFVFNDGLAYTGGNLLIDVRATTNGTYGATSFVGISQTGAPSFYRYGDWYSDRGTENFLPKLRIWYKDNVEAPTSHLDFGTVNCGAQSATQSYTVTNNNTVPMTLTWDFTGPQAGAFITTETGDSYTLASGATKTFSIYCRPGTTTGNLSANFNVYVDGGEHTYCRVALSGRGVADYEATVTPSMLDLGEMLIGGSKTATITVTNTGLQRILPNLTVPDKAEFSVSSDNSYLASGASREYTVTFSPTAEEDYDGTFFVRADAPNINLKVTLKGKGVTTLSPYVVTTNTDGRVDWGGQNVNSGSSFYPKEVQVYNPNSTAVDVTMSIPESEPFYFSNTGSNSTTATIPATGAMNLTLYFNPKAAAAYTGYMTINADGHTSTTRLTGIGKKDNEIVTRDSSFFASLPPYTWKDSDGRTHSSNLTEIATDPDQIIAFLREVYTNKSIPGNYKRGYTTSGGSENFDDVLYSGVGKIKHTGTDYDGVGYSYSNDYGWGIEGEIVTGTHNLKTHSRYYDYAYYAHMNPTQYKPNEEGVTLILVEMLDNYDAYKDDEVMHRVNGDWQYEVYDSDPVKNLRYYIAHSIKSVRLVTGAKRTGNKDDFSSGTLFKIDADKLNKFMLLAKGQLKWIHASRYADYTFDTQYSNYYQYNPDLAFCPYPCYIYNRHLGDGDVTMDGFSNPLAMPAFYNMFEQFSPVSQSSASSAEDLYRGLVEMESFNVEHDCMSVPYRYHQFQMYGDDSEAGDCQDVRDLMFFVPDYRMMKHNNRDAASDATYQKYTNYNPAHPPKMGLYVIHQDSVRAATKADDYYMLKLTWDSNLDDFLPSDKQEYQLWEVVTDEFGVEHYKPVYYMNEQGQYTDKDGHVLADQSNPVPIVLTLNPADEKTYANVYVERLSSSQTKTYAIRGQDTDHFMSLQMSNEQSYIIPGTNPAEMVLLSSATYYSRYNPSKEKNCYSNKVQLKSNPRMIKSSYLSNNPTMTLNRMYSVKNGDATELVTEKVADILVNYGARTMTVTLANNVILKDEYPNGMTSGEAAGYHPNMHNGNDATSWTESFIVSDGYVDFDLQIWDNFVVNVANNEHPGQYLYQLNFTTNGQITENNQNYGTDAYSNVYRVPVYKTDSKIDETVTLAQVLGDNKISDDYIPGDVEFQTQVQLSSKQNILRYDTYRWNQGDDRYIVDVVGDFDDERDLPPTGIAGNQGDYYTVTMNATGTEYYYVGDRVAVNTANTTNWATFVDRYPTNDDTDAGAYVYAPVVELFTYGYKVGSTTETREDYNTYGGPLQNTAVGKLKVTPYYPSHGDSGGTRALMSDYKWYDAGDWCSYYNIMLKFEALDVPEGYELYKVRAWRKVEPDILREQIASRKVRDSIDENGWYLYEDINFGDPLVVDGNMTMSCNTLKLNNTNSDMPMLGERSVMINKPQNPDDTVAPKPLFEVDPENQHQIEGETRATFGAKRLSTYVGDPYGAITSIDAKFKVRAYFSKNSNPLIAGKTGHAPLYILGDDGSNDAWKPTHEIGRLYTCDGTKYGGYVEIVGGNDGYGYFSFTKTLGEWSDINNANIRLGYTKGGNCWLEENNGNTHYSEDLDCSGNAEPGAYKVPTGRYYLELNTASNSLVILRAAQTNGGAAHAPRRAGESSRMTGDDFDYYVAEGECDFHQDGGEGVITGIGTVAADVNREVVGVTYVNALGQQSSRPFEGVNMVVTRYSDGSSTTTKVVK